jgi:hypothetical protein
LLQLTLTLLHLELILLQLLLYLHQKVGHIIGRLYGQDPKKSCGEAAISDRTTCETFPSPHPTAATDRELGVGGRSELRLARHPDNRIFGEPKSSADFGERRPFIPRSLSRPGDVHDPPLFCI